jgi:hypothetical protein
LANKGGCVHTQRGTCVFLMSVALGESQSLYWANAFYLCSSPNLWPLIEHKENIVVVYNCWWLSSAQSFVGPSPVGLDWTLSDLRFLATWNARSVYLYPSGTSWSSFTSRHWFHFFITSSGL